jgi:carbonic anhydrase
MPWEQQSPIHFQSTIRADAPKGYLRLSWSKAIDGFRRDGDHGVEVLFGVTPHNYLELAGKRYHLRQFHFHHPSEHLLGARTFDAEIHLVHQNLEDSSFAVVGIFLSIDTSSEDCEEAATLANSFLAARETSSPFPLIPACWLPDKRDRILRYEGSLTTDPFTESVSWIVFPDAKPITPALFKAIFGGHPQKARAIQAINRRYVLDLAVGIEMVQEVCPA